MADFVQQRKNMVESQIRPSDITDRRIIRAMLETPREQFVAASLKPMAYMDEEVALAKPTTGTETRSLLAPRTLAKMIQLAQIDSKDVVLDVVGDPHKNDFGYVAVFDQPAGDVADRPKVVFSIGDVHDGIVLSPVAVIPWQKHIDLECLAVLGVMLVEELESQSLTKNT